VCEQILSEGGAPPPLWLNRDYLLLWTGQAVSITGTAASGIAFPLLVLFLTRSPFQAGLVGALETIPFLFLGLPAGALVDRWNRKRVMIACDAMRSMAFITIPLALWMGHLSMGLIYLVVLVEGTGFAFFNLAEVSALPQVVARSQLGQASANNQVMWAVGSLAGPPLGGFLYGLSLALPFLADAISYAASVCSLFAIRRPFQSERTTAVRPLLAEVTEGMRWLWRQRLIRFFAFVGGAHSLAFGGVPLAAIVLARQDFHASSSTIGLIFGAVSAGGILGALLGAWLQRRLTLAQAVLGSLWSSVLVYPLLALGPNLSSLAVAGVLLFLTGPTYDIAQFSYRMTRIPDTLQGRVNSLYRILLWGGQPLGRLAGGVLVQAFGPRLALGAMGVGVVMVAVAATLNTELRHAQR
jgi:MFS family permease